jgi:carboxyl-terminal processing protease
VRTVLKIFVAFSILTVAFVCGFSWDTLQDAPKNWSAARWKLGTVPPAALASILRSATAQAQSSDLPPTETYVAAMNAIRTQYYAPAVDRERMGVTPLTYSAIEGMLATLKDPYTVFYTPKKYRDMLQEQSGNPFVGIGARLDTGKDRRVFIVEPMDSSPALKAGLISGDVITAIDDKSVVGVKMEDVISRIKGLENSYVRLTIERKNKLINFRIKRAMVNQPVVTYRMEDEAAKIGYIALDMFNEQADTEFDRALSKLEKQGMKSLIFDLRDNPGGLLNIAQDIASRFLKSGPVVWVKEKSGRVSSLDVEADKHRGGLSAGAYPVVTLVNGNSASASEIVAGSIQDGKAGILVGTRTYGKGLVQTIIPLTGEEAVKITTQHYFTRDKRDINVRHDEFGHAVGGTGGIVPDITVEFTDKDSEAQREAARRNSDDRAAIRRLDPQLQKALEILRK